MPGARLLTLGSSIARFEQLLKLSNLFNSVMYRHYVVKLDRQDDGAAYRVEIYKIVMKPMMLKKTCEDFLYTFSLWVEEK
ncbi:unnamed protein product [Rhizophagus irregularis]|nr:unnamed protein product [Rhizophagus irregularis]